MDIKKLKYNLENIMTSPLTNQSIDFLKQVVNYTPDAKFANLNTLLTVLRTESTSDDLVYCITTLSHIKKVLNYHIENPTATLPLSEDLTIEAYLQWCISSLTTTIKKQITLKEIKVNTPLKLSGQLIKDWLEVDSNLIIVRKVVDSICSR